MTCTYPNSAPRSQLATPLFALGRIVATPGVLDLLDRHGIAADQFLRRHITGDWGDVPPEDAKSNWLAVTHGSRILSRFSVGGERCWIITEADRRVTTLLLPSEY
ncbi:hypothetical protein WM03_24645 [Burkholderia ubonensis]|uniref:hypothetical protein n=1 Tax=Burkholderia ubonensis TaxID=101571 RepID=UPI0007543E69|nr:hypothetical protein [Burkholderia ubonensis]KVN59758.1 hypothetical protein WJ65_02930 [Burkholderia ubonensis]KWI05181.1 hypothetical protein WM02_27565 [Burkholderia ubonensis]KWI22848.1 hypothetical protein WM03_24645 [Burkholderia ubonensis]ODQ40801.1 hypothetical protein BGV63_09360 [Burkholderia ubonensis]OJA31190.1 hypothetical protein BGV58_09335 [Burkholderia ubonensis]